MNIDAQVLDLNPWALERWIGSAGQRRWPLDLLILGDRSLGSNQSHGLGGGWRGGLFKALALEASLASWDGYHLE